VTLGSLIASVLSGEERLSKRRRDVSAYEEQRLLSEPGWDDNLGRTLDDLNCGVGKFVTLVDDAEEVGNICLAISDSP
jgi:ubiquitin-like 1-activating enzyme E1 B